MCRDENRLPGMSQLRREEVGIAAAQTLVAEMREKLLKTEEERFRVLVLKTDLAR